MNKNRLKEILSIPTYTGREDLIREYLFNFGLTNRIPVTVDSKGNVYLIKGVLAEGEKYPCVVAHMDSVHYGDVDLIDKKGRLIIEELNVDGVVRLIAKKEDKDGLMVQTGIGGDDKAGIAVALELMLRYDKIIGAFFVEEESGCRGSRLADKVTLSDVGYFIQFDAPTDNWVSKQCMGVRLFDDGFQGMIQPILDKYGQTNISSDPYTDVLMLRNIFGVNCINFFCGYYDYHTKDEYVVLETIDKAISIGDDMIKLLGNNRYEYI